MMIRRWMPPHDGGHILPPSRGRVFPGFPETKNVEIRFGYACPRLRLSKRQHRRIEGFIGQLEGTEMHPEAATGPQVEMRLNRFLWIHVLLTHEPSWLVSPNWKEGEINAQDAAPDLGEVRAVTGVSCKINDGPLGLDDEPAPKTAVPVVQST